MSLSHSLRYESISNESPLQLQHLSFCLCGTHRCIRLRQVYPHDKRYRNQRNNRGLPRRWAVNSTVLFHQTFPGRTLPGASGCWLPRHRFQRVHLLFSSYRLDKGFDIEYHHHIYHKGHRTDLGSLFPVDNGAQPDAEIPSGVG